MNGPQTGASHKLYYSTGTVAVPVWVEIAEVEDVNVDTFTRNKAELRRRANSRNKNLPANFAPLEVSFTLIHGLGETVFDYINAAFFASTVAEYAIVDGDIATTGTEGIRAPMWVCDFPISEPLEDVTKHELKLTEGYLLDTATEVDLSWHETA